MQFPPTASGTEISQRISDTLSIRGGIENLTDRDFSDAADNYAFTEPGGPITSV